jgi:hypothetical protein
MHYLYIVDMALDTSKRLVDNLLYIRLLSSTDLLQVFPTTLLQVVPTPWYRPAIQQFVNKLWVTTL